MVNPRIARCLVVVCGLALTAAAARGATIARWDFESLLTSDVNILADEGTGTITYAGFTAHTRDGNGSIRSMAYSHADTGDYVQIQVSTTGVSDIGLRWYQNSTANGTGTWDLQYSTNGSTFNPILDDYDIPPLGIWMDTASSGTLFDLDLSAYAALNNQPNVYFRFIAVEDANDLGIDQFDDVLVESGIPEPTTLALLAAGGLTMWRRRAAV